MTRNKLMVNSWEYLSNEGSFVEDITTPLPFLMIKPEMIEALADPLELLYYAFTATNVRAVKSYFNDLPALFNKVSCIWTSFQKADYRSLYSGDRVQFFNDVDNIKSVIRSLYENATSDSPVLDCAGFSLDLQTLEQLMNHLSEKLSRDSASDESKVDIDFGDSQPSVEVPSEEESESPKKDRRRPSKESEEESSQRQTELSGSLFIDAMRDVMKKAHRDNNFFFPESWKIALSRFNNCLEEFSSSYHHKKEHPAGSTKDFDDFISSRRKASTEEKKSQTRDRLPSEYDISDIIAKLRK